ncbi:MAG: helix-turn-helix domain-containing protein [Bacilli bacterium]|nr:helix-turn-helix domain-containing protein [Bacilli bacterium]
MEYNSNIEMIIVKEDKVNIVKLTRDEKKKLKIVKRLLQGEFNGTKAAQMLKVTTRQVRNLKRQVLNEGDEGVVHKNKYNKPANTYDEEIRQAIARLYRREYKGMNFTEFAKEIQEKYNFEQSRSTIYNILREKHIRSPQRKKNLKKKSK